MNISNDLKTDKPKCFICGGDVSISDDGLHYECECDTCNIIFWERKSKYDKKHEEGYIDE